MEGVYGWLAIADLPQVTSLSGSSIASTDWMYSVTYSDGRPYIDDSLKPYGWYKDFVLAGCFSCGKSGLRSKG